MSSCLGVYFDDNIIKYAKICLNGNKLPNIEKYGIKFIKNDYKQELHQIIDETDSYNIPIVINPREDVYYSTKIYDQIKENSYFSSIMKLEYESWCEKNAKSPDRYSYVYMVAEGANEENKKNAFLNITSKNVINEDIALSKSITEIYPANLLLGRLVSPNENSYILVNIGMNLSVTTVINNRVIDFSTYSVGMKELLNEFANVFGSFEKAYDECKKMNVYTEGEDVNSPELEQIVEPIFQEILKKCMECVGRYKSDISQVILTGIGSCFINVDLLFSQFLDVKCKILKPLYIFDETDVKNIYENNSVIEAIALGYEFLDPKYKELKYLSKKSLFSKKIFSSRPNKKISISFGDKTLNTLQYVTIAAGVVLLSHTAFSIIYSFTVNKMKNDIDKKCQNLNVQTEEINSDISYISKNTQEYKDVNDEVENLKNKIESNQIGKFSTYNVASLLQNIIKILPENVRLVNISSDDNKYVTIKASSGEYEDLGYFFAQVKLEGVLNNPKINKVENGETTTIEIGGDLP